MGIFIFSSAENYCAFNKEVKIKTVMWLIWIYFKNNLTLVNINISSLLNSLIFEVFFFKRRNIVLYIKSTTIFNRLYFK